MPLKNNYLLLPSKLNEDFNWMKIMFNTGYRWMMWVLKKDFQPLNEPQLCPIFHLS